MRRSAAEIGIRGHHQQVETHVRGERDDADAHRRFRILTGEKSRRQYLYEAERQQAHRVSHERIRGHDNIVAKELAVAINGGAQRAGQREQTHGRRDRHQKHQA